MRIPLLLALLSGCVSAPVPMRSVKDVYVGKAKCLLVLLPGVGDHAERFAQEGFLEAVRARGLSVDIVSAEPSHGLSASTPVTWPGRRCAYVRLPAPPSETPMSQVSA